jgi:eukaryotic-like serine/threonine-protein kinase
MPYAPDLVGHALDGRYELHALIGEGTFGRVYRGYDRRLAREVAIKVIKPWWAEDPEWADSFGREAQLLARISDPGIVQIYDVGHAEEGLYYVTELVEGESLARRLRRGGSLPVWEACEIAERLCRALEHAHAERIVHRDIKPANVLLSRRGEVKVGDLGIARLADAGTTTDGATATIVGTPRYMAPEQASGQPVTPATDVYSAGIVLYEMLAGEPPFGGESAVEIALRHVQEPVPPLPAGTPGSVARIVQRALAKDAADRYQTAAEMADELARARSSRGSASRGSASRGSASAGSASAGWASAGSASPGSVREGSTRVAPRFSPRRNVNPAARRRSIAALTVALGLLCAMVVGAIALSAGPTSRVPGLHGLTKGAAIAKLRHVHLRAEFLKQFSTARSDTVVGQTPALGTRVKQDSAIQVVLSKGPRPVEIPSVKGSSSSAAVARLHRSALKAKLIYVAAPGTAPGIVTGQSPAAGVQRSPHSTVDLSVAETPTWRYVTSFSGTGSGHSVPFQIRGSEWRIVYHMTYDGTCDFVVFCNGPSAKVVGVGSSSTDQSFDLSDGDSQTQVFKGGPGRYQIGIQAGWDAARWTITVEDWL